MTSLPPDLQLRDFEPHVASTFTATREGESWPIVLTETQALSSGRPGHRAPFFLIFAGTTNAQFSGQGTYALSHATLGELDLFLVPTAPLPDGRPRLVATFN